MEPLIKLKNINKTFAESRGPKLEALHQLNFEINKGDFFIILGPSGAGKSTLLRLMSGLEKSFTGELNYSSEVAPQNISFVFQQFGLLPWLNVTENIALGLKARHEPLSLQREKIEKQLEIFGLNKFRQARPKELSGGMRQRVGLARALVTNPKIIFMDEPFSELDSFTAATLRQEILAIWEKEKLTIVMVTHNIAEALELSTRIACLTKLPARIEKIINNNLPRPRNPRSAEFYKLEDELYQLVKP